jgi:transposase InsO family protein
LIDLSKHRVFCLKPALGLERRAQNSTKHNSDVTRRLRAMGIRDKPIAPASPWQNGFVERLIGSIRRQCVDHLIVLGESHLRRILRAYACYYNEIRTLRSLEKDGLVFRVV